MNSLQQQSVVILGLGISGLAMARWCVRYGAVVTVVDSRPNPPQLALLKSELPDVNFVCGQFESALLESAQFNLIFTSPGIKPVDSRDLLAFAKTKGLQTGNELTLFNWALRDLSESEAYNPHVLAITGTNGKTTVTSLTGKLVACSKMTVAIAGNIGPSLLDTLSEKISRHELPQVWVLELSSFQLTDVTDFEPTSAVVLNVTQDHLDWHGSMVAYIEAKSNIYGSKSTKMVVNRDDATVITMLENAQKINKNRKFCTFGDGLPNRLGDYGLESVNGVTWLVRAISMDDMRLSRSSALC
jgi:UDP-N-acetylmuramoylalanine--D-glutamate ligase